MFRRNKSAFILCLFCAIAVLLSSCNKEAPTVYIDPSPDTITLEGRAIEFDTIPGIIGCLSVVDDGYLFYLYQSEHFLMLTDFDYNIKGFSAHKGSGANEVTGISVLFGDISGDDGFQFCDPYKGRIYRASFENPSKAVQEIELLADRNVPAPLYVSKLRDSHYAIVPLAYEYGIYDYDINSGSIVKWPIGYPFPEDKLDLIASHRWIMYNRESDTMIDNYGVYPLVILRNGGGEVMRILQYGEIPDIDNVNSDSSDPIADVSLTDKYVVCLYNGDDSDKSTVLVTDYEGWTFTAFSIHRAQTVRLLPEKGRLIAVNPASDDYSLMEYRIPDNIL